MVDDVILLSGDHELMLVDDPDRFIYNWLCNGGTC